MRYLTIPGTDLRASVLCLGTNRFGSELDARASGALLDAFVESGGNFIDTAHIYADWIPGAPRNASEKTIGAWLKTGGPPLAPRAYGARGRRRDQIVLATKGGHPDLAAMHRPRLSRADLEHDVNDSLTGLQTDYIDLYWLHRDDPARPVSEILEALNAIQRTGKIRYFGCSNWRASRLRSAHTYAQEHGLAGFVANQPQWSLAAPNPAALSDPKRLVVFDAEAYVYHQATGLAVVPWSAQGQGYFDKLDRLGAEGLAEADRRKFDSAANRALYPKVKALAGRYGAPVGAIALSYLLSQPFATYPVIGPRTVDQWRASLSALTVTLTAEDLAGLQPSLLPA
jgi:aryl-alcohol dehydrogenase-like predicted oxidoreductase